MEFSLNFGAKPSLIGVDIGDHSVKMVELKRVGKGQDQFQVEKYAISPLPPDAMSDGNLLRSDAMSDGNLLRSDAMVKILENTWKQLGTSTRNVALALPVSQVISKRVSVPNSLSSSELQLFVEQEAAQYVPFPIEDVFLDYQILGPSRQDPNENEVLVVAAKKETVQDRLDTFLLANLKPVVVEVENFSMQRGLRQVMGGRNSEVVGHVDIGSRMMKISMYANGEHVYAREQGFGGSQLTQDLSRAMGVSLEEAELAKRTGNLSASQMEEWVQPFVNTMALEISRALQFFYTSTAHVRCDRLLLSGGSVMLPDVISVVQDRVDAEVEICNPFREMSLGATVRPQRLIGDASSLMVACGLALRRFDQ